MSDLDCAITLLQMDSGRAANVRATLQRYHHALRQWSPSAKLMSRHAIESEFGAHCADSLSLAPYVINDPEGSTRSVLWDIGSGGGFPVIPLAAVNPNLPIKAFERSDRKAAFLRHVKGLLGLNCLEVFIAHVGHPTGADSPRFVTMRAVEDPEDLVPTISSLLNAGSTLLCQSNRLEQLLAPAFQVSPVHDDWDRAGLRRGRLSLVTAA